MHKILFYNKFIKRLYMLVIKQLDAQNLVL